MHRQSPAAEPVSFANGRKLLVGPQLRALWVFENKVEGYKTSWGAAAQASAGHVYGSDPAAAWAITSTQEPASVFDGTFANPDYDDTTAYPVQFRVVTPEVETAARDNLDISLSGSYLLRLDEDEFGYTVV